MPVTYTASDQLAQPRAVHVGTNVVRSQYSSTVCLSVSDVVFFAKIPFGAQIVDGYITGTIDSAGTTVKVGIQGTDTALMQTHTLSGTAVLWRFDATQLGTTVTQVTGSDDATPRYKYVILTVVAAASITASCSLTCVVEYVMGTN